VDDKPSHTLLFAMLYEAQSLVAYNFSDKPRLHNYPRVWSVAQARSHGAAGRRGQLPSKFVLCRLPWSPPQKKRGWLVATWLLKVFKASLYSSELVYPVIVKAIYPYNLDRKNC